MDVVFPVKNSNWSSPIVPVAKPDGSIRICGDYSGTVNLNLKVEIYPQPRREELFSKLAGGNRFSKIDLSNAYLQMELDDDSKEMLTINTSKGLFRYNRLPFGIASAPAIFQRAIEQIMQGFKMVLVYQDDILITAKNDKDHLRTLDEVLSRLKAYGLRVKPNKVTFFAESLNYLGYKIDAHGVHVINDKVEAILHVPAPTNVSQLRSFLGTVNYYSSFIQNISQGCHTSPKKNPAKIWLFWHEIPAILHPK